MSNLECEIDDFSLENRFNHNFSVLLNQSRANHRHRMLDQYVSYRTCVSELAAGFKRYITVSELNFLSTSINSEMKPHLMRRNSSYQSHLCWVEAFCTNYYLSVCTAHTHLWKAIDLIIQIELISLLLKSLMNIMFGR